VECSGTDSIHNHIYCDDSIRFSLPTIRDHYGGGFAVDTMLTSTIMMIRLDASDVCKRVVR